MMLTLADRRSMFSAEKSFGVHNDAKQMAGGLQFLLQFIQISRYRALHRLTFAGFLVSFQLPGSGTETAFGTSIPIPQNTGPYHSLLAGGTEQVIPRTVQIVSETSSYPHGPNQSNPEDNTEIDRASTSEPRVLTAIVVLSNNALDGASQISLELVCLYVSLQTQQCGIESTTCIEWENECIKDLIAGMIYFTCLSCFSLQLRISLGRFICG